MGLGAAQAELGGQWALYMLENKEGQPVAVVLPVTAGVEGTQPLPKLQEACPQHSCDWSRLERYQHK